MKRMGWTSLGLATALALTSSGWAAESSELPPPDLPEITLESVPPRFSYEFALGFGFHELTYWRDEVSTWMGLGVQGAWGRNLGAHRVGVGLSFVTEGPIPIHMTLALEPALRWDWVNHGVQLGASVGPAVLLHHTSSTVLEETVLGVAPVAALRAGYSQGWSRVGRRLFVLIEPKVRFIQMPEDHEVSYRFNPSVALVVGSGRGY